jgi:hypothetical protein
LVKLNVDVIVTHGTPGAVAAKQATSTVPIVAISGDPIAAGLVVSLARPVEPNHWKSVLQRELSSVPGVGNKQCIFDCNQRPSLARRRGGRRGDIVACLHFDGEKF